MIKLIRPIRQHTVPYHLPLHRYTVYIYTYIQSWCKLLKRQRLRWAHEKVQVEEGGNIAVWWVLCAKGDGGEKLQRQRILNAAPSEWEGGGGRAKCTHNAARAGCIENAMLEVERESCDARPGESRI